MNLMVSEEGRNHLMTSREQGPLWVPITLVWLAQTDLIWFETVIGSVDGDTF